MDSRKGRLKKDVLTYRFRWDDIKYQPGELYVATYKDGKPWATDTVRTTGEPTKLRLTPDRTTINADGHDLSFVTVEVLDTNGDLVRQADNPVTFSSCGAGSIIATDNGFQADFTSRPRSRRFRGTRSAARLLLSSSPNQGSLVKSLSGSRQMGYSPRV